MTNRFLLIHGNALAYKSYYSLASIPFELGKRESPISLFAKIILKILKDYKPTYCAVVFDKPSPAKIKKSTFTLSTSHPSMSTSLLKEIASFKKILKALNILVVQKKGYKASDLIGKLAESSSKRNLEIIIISSNKDVLQLISENIRVINPFQDYKVYSNENIKQEIGVSPEQIPDFLALTGEKEANIPGIEGIGEKKAIELLKEYSNIENIIEKAQNLKEQSSALRLYKNIALINKKIPIDFDLEEYALKPYNIEKITKVFKSLGLLQLLMNFIDYKKPEHANYKTILTENELDNLIKKISGVSEIAVDTETTSASPTRANVVGISLSFREGEAYYIPLAHKYLGAPKQLDLKSVLQRLRPVLQNPKIKKIGQNIKYDYTVLKRAGLEIKDINFDTMIASHLLNPVRGEHSLKYLALKYLGYKMLSYEELVGDKKSIAEIDIEKVTDYSCDDADFTLRLKNKLLPLLEKENLDKVFYEIEVPLISVLADMEITGVKVDKEYLDYLASELAREIETISQEIHELAGQIFNLNSPQQLSDILFEKLKLALKRKSKTGYYSTSSFVLETLKDKHPIINKIIEYRNLAKLKDGFVVPLIQAINPKTGRIHTSFHQIGTATGRLSSSNPNLQNIPIRAERAKEIRKAFIAEKGKVLLSADYSQIELRIMAHFSKDELLTKAFLDEKDIHTETAIHLFNIPENKITHHGGISYVVSQDDRRKAKAVNFGIIYGISPYGLAQNIGSDEQTAKTIIDTYFSSHRGVKKLIDEILTSTKEKGYVTTLTGRKREIKNINSDNKTLRLQAEREAINTPIQGTAAEVIKLAMLDIHRKLKKKALNTKMLLQIHDELLFEVPEKEVGIVSETVKECMENAIHLNIPLKVTINTGENWFEAH
ncbi:MAG: DNA polymerase I [Candidatus Ratteibacteria bacterium]|nr:DNA polymerase I [Candidatus Ratteibacteria bacterium]